MSVILIALLVTIGVVIVAVGVIFLTGIYHVRKGRVYIMEKYNEFYKLLEPGWYYFAPLVYRRRAWYPTTDQVRTYKLDNGNTINLYYRIKDVCLYHYGGIKIYDKLIQIVDTHESVNDEIFKEGFNEIGIEYIKIEPVKK